MNKVSDKHPPPHAQYLVRRGGRYFTATPCYGLHLPWWVVRLMPENWPNEAEPVAMEGTDEWLPLDEAEVHSKKTMDELRLAASYANYD